MVSLWGTKDSKRDEGINTEENERRGEGSDSAHGRHSREADERTRLLPRNDGYLDPDDPAVSDSRS